MNRSPPVLPATTRLGRTALRVDDRSAMVAFYRDVVGLEVRTRDATRTVLGVDGSPLLVLLADEDADPRDEQTAGLYHTAFRFPSRAALAVASRRVRDRWRLDGASDHGISEALYLTDPEGNGVELYRDRPREAWPRDDGTIEAMGAPLDIEALEATADGAETGDDRTAPPGTTIGHIHLEVTSLEAAREFYVETLGFDVTMSYSPGALFVAAGDYHHHIGLNTWNHRSTPATGRGRGLAWFELLVPEAAFDAVNSRLAGSDAVGTETGDGFTVTDPDGISIRFRPDFDSDAGE